MQGYSALVTSAVLLGHELTLNMKSQRQETKGKVLALIQLTMCFNLQYPCYLTPHSTEAEALSMALKQKQSKGKIKFQVQEIKGVAGLTRGGLKFSP